MAANPARPANLSPSSSSAPDASPNSPQPEKPAPAVPLANQPQDDTSSSFPDGIDPQITQPEQTSDIPTVQAKTNPVVAPNDDPEMDAFNRRAAKTFRIVIRWGYMLLLLAFLAWQARRLWRQWQKHQSKR
jgi:hypothetical protein